MAKGGRRPGGPRGLRGLREREAGQGPGRGGNFDPFSPGGEGSVPPGLLAAAERARGAGGRRRRRGRPPASGGLRLLTGLLAGIAAALALIIAAGTLYVLIEDPGAFSGAGGAADSGLSGVAAGVTGMAGDAAIGTIGTAGVTGTTGVSGVTGADPASETGMFTGIGRMRIAAGQRTTVVLSIVFPYSPADRPFAEELAGKIPVFRQIARDYFAGLSRDELDSLDEQKAKAEILRGFNDELRLGQIALLLFNDLLVLE